MSSSETLVRAENLTKYFPVRKGILFQKEIGQVRAVDGVEFSVPKGASFGLVGESGSGKTTVAKMLLRIETPTAGSASFRGKDIFKQSAEDSRRYQRSVQAVFQDPYSSLSPRMQIWEIIAEPLLINEGLKQKELKERAAELLETVGLAADRIHSYPHQFSGGQRQRIAIARALSPNPEFIVLDEPVSGLDVSIRAQILNLLKGLQNKFGLTMFMISHDLASLRYMSDIVAVMYLGQLIEVGSSDQVYNDPKHPYTQVLLSSVPVPFPEDRKNRQRIKITGEVPSALNPPAACRFHTRCPFAMAKCSEVAPETKEIEPGHKVACHLY